MNSQPPGLRSGTQEFEEGRDVVDVLNDVEDQQEAYEPEELLAAVMDSVEMVLPRDGGLDLRTSRSKSAPSTVQAVADSSWERRIPLPQPI